MTKVGHITYPVKKKKKLKPLPLEHMSDDSILWEIGTLWWMNRKDEARRLMLYLVSRVVKD